MKTCKAIIVSLLLAACPAAWADSFSTGTNYLGQSNVTQALIAFSNAVTSAPSDQANVYLALTRVLALPVEPAGSNFLNQLAFTRTTNVFDFKLKPKKNTNGKWAINDNLNADEFPAEIRNDIVPALGASETNLAQITDTAFSLLMPGSVTHFSDVTLDYGDVQMLRALLSATAFYGYALNTGNLDAQFGAVSNIVMTDKSIQAVLSANPDLLTITNTSDLVLARSAFTNAVGCYMAASQFIRNTRAPGVKRLFNLDTTDMNDVNAEANFRLFITDLESSLGSPFGGTPDVVAGAVPGAKFYGAISAFSNHIVSLSNFFAGDFNVRSLLPTLTTNGVTFIWDSFTNTTFGGVLTGLTQTNLDKVFVKVFHAQAQLNVPGIACSVVGSVPNNSEVASPLNGVVLDGGNFYGTTQYGGTNGSGSFFKLATDGTFTLLYSGTTATNSPAGSDNPSSLLVGSDGNLYGTTEYSDKYPNGTIFKLTTGGSLTGMFKFGQSGGADEGANGGNPLIQGTDGNLYGTTPTGGDNGSGIIFQISTTSPYNFNLLYSFDPASDLNGNTTAGAGTLLQGSDGNFYGVTQFGGDNGAGSIFQFVPASGGNGAQFNTLYSFPPLYDAYLNPMIYGINTLVDGGSGLFYGSTEYGGTNDLYTTSQSTDYDGGGDGMIFSIDTQGNFNSLYSFDANQFDGFNPIGAMVKGGNGSFYGIASSGGANGDGTIFQFTPSGATGSVVWFDKGLGKQPGAQNSGYGRYNYSAPPAAGLTASGGVFYGTAPNGGANGNGTVFSLSGTGLSGDYPPTISTPPAGAIAGVGANVTLTVSASGSGTLGYQWRKNGSTVNNSGTHITGAGTDGLTLSGLLLTDAGSYTVVVKNSYGSITSTPPAVLTVVGPPTITNQPVTATNIAQGQQLSLSVGASNSPAGGSLTYLWYRNTTQLTDGLGASGETTSGSATSNLVINPAYGADSGSYYVAVSNTYAGATSLLSRVTVGVSPYNLVISPAGTNSLVGSNVTLTVSASGTTPLSYHWFKNATNALSNGGRVSGATTNKLTLSDLALADTGSYSVLVTNSYGKASNLAVVIVLQQPIINREPFASASTIYQGQPLNLKVAATGSGTLTYQWLSNNVNLTDVPNFISGTASSNLVINPVSTSDSASYSVVVANSVTNVTSSPLAVTVKADTTKPSVTITSPPANARSNAPVTFSGTASESVSGVNVLITNITYWITNLNGVNSAATTSNSIEWTPGTASLTNWTFKVSPPAGSNVFAVQSQDFSGNTSAVVTVKFFLKSPAPLTVNTSGSGNGTVKGTNFISGDTVPANGAMLNIGESYAIAATPGTNCFFNGWTGTAGVTNGTNLIFIMQNGTTLNASFITNIFVEMAGNYNGLFSSDALGIATEETAGLIGNLALTSQGGYTATLYLGGSYKSFPSPASFNHLGKATNVIKNTAEGTVTVEMTVNANTTPRTITATVIGTNSILVNGADQTGWTSAGQLIASLTQSSNFARNYTMLIPPPPTVTPPGYGYVLLTNDPADATVTLNGFLADGATFSQAAPIGEDDTIAVYPIAYSGSLSGVLWGKLTLSPAPATPTPTGNLTWIRKGPSSGMFEAGFTNDSLTVEGSPWSNSVPLDTIIVTNSQFTVVGAGVNTSVACYVSPTNHTNIVSNTKIAGFKSATVNTNTGQLTLLFTNTGNVHVTGGGALLQTPYAIGSTTNIGGGFFTMPSSGASPTNAGSILLSPPQ